MIDKSLLRSKKYNKCFLCKGRHKLHASDTKQQLVSWSTVFPKVQDHDDPQGFTMTGWRSWGTKSPEHGGASFLLEQIGGLRYRQRGQAS